MKTLLVAVTLLVAACDSEAGDDEPVVVTIRDLVIELANAAQARAIRCEYADAGSFGQRVEAMLCANFDCSAEAPAGSDMPSCVVALEVHDCAERDYPAACTDETLRWHFTAGHR
jgi:hypothetical protein